MSLARLLAVGVTLFATGACANDDWAYRPRMSLVTDAPSVDALDPMDTPFDTRSDAPDVEVPRTDAASTDVFEVLDATIVDATREDVVDAAPDASLPDATLDAMSMDVVPADAGPTTLSLHANGIATTGTDGLRAGTLRLTETGFEIGGRTCVGSLCLSGGITP